MKESKTITKLRNKPPVETLVLEEEPKLQVVFNNAREAKAYYRAMRRGSKKFDPFKKER